MKIETKLARAFKAVAGQEQQMDSTAAGILAVFRGVKRLTADKFNKLVRDAYTANGWNTRPGRPNGGDEPKEAVPATVRTYVTIVRTALRERMKLGRYRTFTALRADLARKQGRNHRTGRKAAKILRLPAPVAEQFQGVEIEQPKPNGALFHDLGVLYAKLPSEHQTMFERQIKRIMAKYAPMVSGTLAKELRTAADLKEQKLAA